MTKFSQKAGSARETLSKTDCLILTRAPESTMFFLRVNTPFYDAARGGRRFVGGVCEFKNNIHVYL
jgi:hypothetical protein